jgi:uncharacterized RDD family membrane protein YckC
MDESTLGITSANTSSEPVLSGKETRKIVTPYAFHVADELLGQPLATPFRRGLAQLIDFTCVILLSSAHALILAFFVAITFMKAGRHLVGNENNRFLRNLLRFGAASLLFLITYVVVESLNKDTDSHVDDHQLSIAKPIIKLAEVYSWKTCDGDWSCQRELAQPLGEAMAETDISRTELSLEIQQTMDDAQLDPVQQDSFRHLYLSAFDSTRATIEETKSPTYLEPTVNASTATTGDDIAEEHITQDDKGPSDYSVVGWLKGIISELGLGFGWAALYYSVFTAWWQGSTPGKRLLGLKVVKLDGSSLTLWESFGRYGGYGAGLATGLLGFIQVYWDPNRQAIQDKISETLVLSKPKK